MRDIDAHELCAALKGTQDALRLLDADFHDEMAIEALYYSVTLTLAQRQTDETQPMARVIHFD